MHRLEHLRGVIRSYQEEAALYSRLEKLLSEMLIKARTLAVAARLAGFDASAPAEEARKLLSEGGIEGAEKAHSIVDEACRAAAARAFEALTGASLDQDECRAPGLLEALSRLQGEAARTAAILIVGGSEKLSEVAERAGRVRDWSGFMEAASKAGKLAAWLAARLGIDASGVIWDAARSRENPEEAAEAALDALEALARGIEEASRAITDAERFLEFCWDEAPAEACGRLAEARRGVAGLLESLRGSRIGLEEAASAARRVSKAVTELRRLARIVKLVREAVVEAGLTSMAAEMLMRLLEEGRIDMARLSAGEAEAVLTLCRRGLARCTATLR